MAFRGLSNNEKQINSLARQIAQANSAQSQALSNLQGARAGYDAASNKPLGGTLGSVLSGIGNSIKNIGDTAWLATNDVINGWRDLAAGKSKNAEDSYTQQARKKILGGNNAKERYGMAGGKALDAAVTLSDLIPGVAASPVANIAQGALSGIGQTKAENPNATAEELTRNALIGGGAGAAGLVAGNALGKVAGKQFKNATAQKLANAATSQLGRGAIGGATAGATGAGLATALNGGSLGDVLSNMAQGAQGGALGGATVAGTLGLAGRGYSALKNRAMGAQNGAGAVNAPIVNDLPTLKKNPLQDAANAPEAQVRNIPITDYDAGTERVPVNIRNTRKGTGRYIDGYVQGENLPEGAPRTRNGYINDILTGKNLPEAELPNNEASLRKLFGMDDYNGNKTLAEAIARGEMGDSEDVLEYLKETLDPADYRAIRNGAADYWNTTHDDGVFGAYKNKSDLPKIDLDDYKDYWLGRTGQTRADIEPELLPFVEEGGRKLGSNDWEDIGLKNGEYTPEDILDKYREFARTDMRKNYYTNDNIGGALAMDENLYDRTAQQIVDDNYPRRTIDVQGGPARADEITVNATNTAPTAPQGMAEPNYTRRTLNAEPENLPAPRQSADVAPVQPEETALIQPGTPEYAAFKQQEELANQRRELESQIIGGVRDQYGTIRMSNQIEGLPDAMLDMAKLGLTDRAQIDGFVERITGKDGIGSKIIRKSLDKAGDIDTNIPTTMQAVYDRANAGADKNVQMRINRALESAGKKYRVNEDGTMSRLDMYDLGKGLEKEGYTMLRRGKRNENSGDYKYGDALVDLSKYYIEKATNGVDVASNVNANALKNVLPGNQEWASRVDVLLAKPNLSIQDVRALMANPTKLSLLSEAERYNMGTYGQRVADTANTAERAIRGATSANPVTALGQVAASKFINSKTGKQMAIKNAQKKLAKINGQAPIKQALANGIKAALADNAGKVANKAANIAERVAAPLNDTTIANASYAGLLPTFGDVANRQIARQAGLTEGNYANNRNELQGAANDYANAAANYMYTGDQAQQLRSQIPQPTATQAQSTDPREKLSQAMDLAMAAGDMTAWTQLADLYSQANKLYATEEKEPKALSSNQSKALAAMEQLQTLSQMTPTAKTAMSSTILNPLVNLTGGDDYANQAQALALTIGYLMSGANVPAREAERLGQSYVPTAFDSEEVRQNKLARAQKLLQSYLDDTSALE